MPRLEFLSLSYSNIQRCIQQVGGAGFFAGPGLRNLVAAAKSAAGTQMPSENQLQATQNQPIDVQASRKSPTQHSQVPTITVNLYIHQYFHRKIFLVLYK